MTTIPEMFLAASMMTCSISGIIDPTTHDKGYLIKCGDEAKQAYIQPSFVKSRRHAKEIAKRWLEANRTDKFMIRASDLLAQMKPR